LQKNIVVEVALSLNKGNVCLKVCKSYMVVKVTSDRAERPTMKEVVALLMEVKSPPEEWGKTSQPLIKQSSNQS
jgi:hypothetical protein